VVSDKWLAIIWSLLKDELLIAERFFSWAKTILPKTNPDSLLGKAVSYALNCKDRLMNAFYDGRLEISNNRAERGLRAYSVGKNN
jgi:hypothetical protein